MGRKESNQIFLIFLQIPLSAMWYNLKLSICCLG